MEILISRLLALGVILSSLVIIAGGALMLASQGATVVDIHAFHGEPISLAAIASLFESAGALRPRLMIQLGLVILVATPVLRVALSLLLFVKRRDYLYVGITGLVLAILVVAIAGAN
jgi:uncharacterized membrane protein